MTTVKVDGGLGIEATSVGLGLDSNDTGGTVVGKISGLPGVTVVTVTFSQHYVKRPSAVIVTNAYRDLGDHGNFCVMGWGHSSFTIWQDFKDNDNSPPQVIPLYYYHVVE